MRKPYFLAPVPCASAATEHPSPQCSSLSGYVNIEPPVSGGSILIIGAHGPGTGRNNLNTGLAPDRGRCDRCCRGIQIRFLSNAISLLKCRILPRFAAICGAEKAVNILWLCHGKSKIRQDAANQCRQWQSNGSKNRGGLLPSGEGEDGKINWNLNNSAIISFQTAILQKGINISCLLSIQQFSCRMCQTLRILQQKVFC